MTLNQRLAFIIGVVFAFVFMTLEPSLAAVPKQPAAKSKKSAKPQSPRQLRKPVTKEAAAKPKKAVAKPKKGAKASSSHQRRKPISKKVAAKPTKKQARHASHLQRQKSLPKRVAIRHKKGARHSLAHQTRRHRFKHVALDRKYHHQGPSHNCYLHQQGGLGLCSNAALIQDQMNGAVLYQKNVATVMPIASITKLMTAMVALDAGQPLWQMLTIGNGDVDFLRSTRSRLPIGASLTREDILRLALMSSENRAASALSRYYPGGTEAFVRAMNYKARLLGLRDTYFLEPTGLSSANVSSPRDLARLVAAAYHYPLIREFTTTPQYVVNVDGRPLIFRNTNSLVNSPVWNIGLSKTGFIRESGMCLVMLTWFDRRPVVIVLLNSPSKLTRIGDADRVRKWFEAPMTYPRLSGVVPLP